MNEKTKDKIIELRNKDLGYKTIAKELGLKRGQVRYICLKNGLGGKRAKQVNQFGTLQERKQKFIKEFENKFPDFEYHSDFKDIDSNFKMKCKICGYIQERNAQCVRPSRDKELQCDNCEKIRLKEKRTKEKNEREKREKTTLRNRLIKLIKNEVERLYKEPLLYKSCKRCGKEYKANTINSIHCDKCIEEIKAKRKKKRKEWEGKTIKCDECGKEFEMKRADSRFCSTKCSDKYFYRKKEIERRKQLKENGRINYRVTLDKLIERDNGICQICNKPIDKNDYKVTDEGYFIVGNNYPSLDHIIPVAKGGTHTWDNVQLAHHHCNSIKSDKMII